MGDQRKPDPQERIVAIELLNADSVVMDFDVFAAPRYRTAAEAVRDIRYITGHLHNVYARFTTATGKPWPLPVDAIASRYVGGYVRGDEVWKKTWRGVHRNPQRS